MSKKVEKKSVAKAKSPIYFRYEFSDEKGRLEGGDIFTFSSAANLKKMMEEVMKVAEGDGVTVSFTIGKEEQFFKFLHNLGLSQKEVENEMVDAVAIPFLGDDAAPKAKKSPSTQARTKKPKAAKSVKKSARK